MLAALDHWSTDPTLDAHRRRWLLKVARGAADPGPNPTGWRARARDPAVRADQAALLEVAKDAPVADQPPQLLLALARGLKFDSPEKLSFLQRIQRAHAGDFWANLKLADELSRIGQKEEAIRYYQAAVASNPRVSLGYHNLALALLLTKRTEEAVAQLVRFVAWFADRPRDVRRDRHRTPPTMPIPWGQRPIGP